jgi:hypothetical protein
MSFRSLFGCIAAVCALMLSSVANAVPIYLNFTGTAVPTSWPLPEDGPLGSPVQGSFTFETDLLTSELTASGIQQSFLEYPLPPARPTATASVNIGGKAFNPFSYSDGYASINYVDACNPPPGQCFPSWAENFNLHASSSDFPSVEDYTGEYHSAALWFSSVVPYDPFNLGAPRVNYFDLADGVTAATFLDLPLYNLLGGYSETTFSCVAGQCAESGRKEWQFNIDSVSRGAVSVPEPGTIGLAITGLLALLIARRRRV